MYPIVSVNWLKENFDHPNLVVLDASPKSNVSGLQTEHPDLRIKGARYFDIKNNFCDLNSDLPNTIPSPEQFTREAQKLGIHQDSIIVIYDNLGVYTSPRARWLFKVMGHQNVAVLDGGLPAWINAGFDTETTKEEAYEKGNFQANLQPALVRYTQDILNNISNPRELVLDARSKGRFDGTSPEPRAHLSSGHMPNAKSLPWKEVIHEGHLKSKAELKEIFENLNPDRQAMVFTCGSGLTACVIMLAAELVDEDSPKSIYDGSWTEWAQLEDAPIIK